MSTWAAPLVLLIDGRTVPSDSEEWRAECEARWILHMPTKAMRFWFLDQVSNFRGEAAAKELRAHVLRIHEHNRNRKQKNDGDN